MEYWFLFPTGLLVATLSMSSGIAGSNFWIPIYLLWLALEPRVAFWVSLLTMLFGFGSGVVRNLVAGTVDGPLVRRYLTVGGPAAALGAALSTQARSSWLLLTFALFVLSYGAFLVREFAVGEGRQQVSQQLEGEAQQGTAWVRGSLAGFLQGLIATGSGIVFLPLLLRHRRDGSPAVAVGSTVVLVFACSLISVAFRIDGVLWEALEEHRDEILSMMLCAAPGVILGGQLGPRIAQRLPRRLLRLYVGVLLLGVGALIAVRGLGAA